MLHIIGLILKILGILLLCIAVLLILFLGILLFVPVRYELEGDFPEKISDARASFRLTWLLHFLSAKMCYEGQKFAWWIRVAWKKLPKEECAVDEKEKVPEHSTEEPIKESPMDHVKGPEKEKSEESFQNVIKESITQPQEDVEKESPTKKTGKKFSVFERLKRKFIDIWQKIKYTFTKICGKIKDISKNISDGKEVVTLFLNDEVHKSAFKKVKKEFIWIKRLLKPKIFRIHLKYGFEDPCFTGQVLALLSMVYPFVGDNMEVEPDFEKKILKGNVHIKGRIRLVYLAVFGIKLFTHKEMRKTFMEVMHMVTK